MSTAIPCWCSIRPRCCGNAAVEPLFFMFAALCHDLGKIDSTRVEEDGRITSHMHPVSGRPLAERQLHRLCDNARLLRYVDDMVLNHMRPNAMAMSQSKKKKTRLLFDGCVCPEDLILLSRADASASLARPMTSGSSAFCSNACRTGGMRRRSPWSPAGTSSAPALPRTSAFPPCCKGRARCVLRGFPRTARFVRYWRNSPH